MTLGQEFGAFADTIAEDAERGAELGTLFLEVNLGGTAIGTGAGAAKAYQTRIIGKLREVTGLPVTGARNLIDATRSEERRVGKECVSTCRSRWSPDH